ncbi:hypothetical protein LTR78_005754 [Recurvomyces mirabilis]|uniref:Dienelactone hydrolase domain-containing protein n=1 Tax=Recurvomyces mirabilis TaxID=574656 RepID=A0AAE0WM75_9PEZI|nr:hypothetical protein LTR78_005754 [Recurvomyces mirabilis]KAK5154133.1 hypothetical protein LTS14_006818 [Recurvomyces mirabilis]
MPMDGGPPDEDKMEEFCDGPGETQRTLRRIESLIVKFQKMYPKIRHWGLVGYCWGGYIVNFAIDKDSRFQAAVQCHTGWPPGVDVAQTVSAPLLALNSRDEPETDYREFKQACNSRTGLSTFRIWFMGGCPLVETSVSRV